LLGLFAAMLLAASGCDRSGETGAGADTSTSSKTTVATTDAAAAPAAQAEPTHVVVIQGAFGGGIGSVDGLPDDAPQKGLADIDVPASAAESLTKQAPTIVDQVVRRRGVEPTPDAREGLPKLVVSLGDAVEVDPKRPMTHRGLLVKVDLQRVDGTHRAASRQIPPATNSGELMANLDHTLDKLVVLVLEDR
jgi:hypothetical protein